MALVTEIGFSGFQVHWAGGLLIIAAAAGIAVNAFVNPWHGLASQRTGDSHSA